MSVKNKICEFVEAHEKELTADELVDIAFLCDCLAQEKRYEQYQESEEQDREFFYTGE